MAVHHGGKVGRAGKTLASNSSSKSAKSKAGKTLANHNLINMVCVFRLNGTACTLQREGCPLQTGSF